jgi:hypothetical protein
MRRDFLRSQYFSKDGTTSLGGDFSKDGSVAMQSLREVATEKSDYYGCNIQKKWSKTH